MPARPTSVHIPQPCAESWAAMTPRGPGRHCAACQKTVVDFTQKTDAEILAVLQHAAGRTCGRFAAGQLGRPLRPLAVGAPSRWQAWLAAAVAVWGLREGAGAAARAQVPVEQGPRPVERKVGQAAAAVAPTAVVLHGVVLDSATRQGLPGVTVLLKSTLIGISTGDDGRFALEVPTEQLKAAGRKVVISFVGYISQEIILETVGNAAQMQIVMRPSHADLDGLIVINRKPWPWHPRRFYYWLTRPFRRG
ncbi:carboxypeptidase-like regulatory domain-containing protein [Hymenobacter nivis]|uniref:Carboxypeptidase-like regulatory domain-containing protein n=1 Tax=Hymenobacter nivis TaxID=1850093 RepID=A0A2Z3GRG7_9BACT|nr:carboxypeptidase-like regulatory domain-containing protein [Hymenobacter nivis]AWM33946.1 hypothetical protein DDQ68_14820 [Hymenobacter nivis]